MQLLYCILVSLFVFSLFLVFKAHSLKSNENSFKAMFLCTIGIAFMPYFEAEILRASEMNVFHLAKIHLLLTQLILFLAVISLWYTRKQYLKNKISKVELTFPWVYSFLSLCIFILYYTSFESICKLKQINGLWAYHLENVNGIKTVFGIWLGTSLTMLMLLIYSSYKKAVVKEKKSWLNWLVLTLTVVPSMIFYLFFLSDSFEYCYFLLSPLLIVCSFAWVYVYSNFKLFEASPINALANIMENIPTIILTVDTKYKIRYINKTGNNLLKFKRKSIINKPLQLFLRVLKLNHLLQKFSKINTLAKGQSIDAELNIAQDFHYKVSISPIFTRNNKKSGFVIIAHDISQLRKQETKLTQANKELIYTNKDLEQFAYIASHDLKTPLRNIVSFSGLLRKSLEKRNYDDMKEYIDFIIRYGKSMNQIVSDALEMSQITKKTLSISQVDVQKIIEDVKLTLSEKIDQKNVIVNYQNLPIMQGNKSQLEKLFENLIENSIKYNESEVPEISISYCTAIEGKHKLIVQDNGIGFEQKYADEVFKMFKRLHAIDEYNGTGIGLALCKKIVQTHGGSIYASSEKGFGTRISFVIPKEIESDVDKEITAHALN